MILLHLRVNPRAVNPRAANPSRANPSRANRRAANPSRADPSRADLSRADPSRADHLEVRWTRGSYGIPDHGKTRTLMKILFLCLINGGYIGNLL